MLAKLLKYEFKATGRVLLPLYAALLVLSLLGNLQRGIIVGPWQLGIFEGLVLVLYGCVFGASLVATVLLLIQRFYKNLLRDEGYLMHTLPVKPWQNVAAKLLTAVVWSVVGLGAATLSVFLLGMDWLDWQTFFEDFGKIMAIMTEEYGLNVVIYALEGLLCTLLALAQSILSVYLAMALGHLAHRARVMWSVAAYIGLHMAEYFVAALLMRIESATGLLSNAIDFVMQNILHNNEVLIAHFMVDGFGLLNLVLGAVMFAATAWILQRHLNLE